MSPVSNAPLLAVKVCVVPSLFFTVTFEPAFTSSVFGVNARFLIVTDGLLARGVDAPAGPTTRLVRSNRRAVRAVTGAATDRVRVECMPTSMPYRASGRFRHAGHVRVQRAHDLVGAGLLHGELARLPTLDVLGLERAVDRREIVGGAVLVLHLDRDADAHRELVRGELVALDDHRGDGSGRGARRRTGGADDDAAEGQGQQQGEREGDESGGERTPRRIRHTTSIALATRPLPNGG